MGKEIFYIAAGGALLIAVVFIGSALYVKFCERHTNGNMPPRRNPGPPREFPGPPTEPRSSTKEPVFVEESKAPPLTFDRLREVNVLRCNEGFGKQLSDWSSAQWACAAGGEMGELQNLIKKEFRGDSIPQINQQIAHEIADVVIYLDLLATSRGLDLGQIVREKFNIVSRRVNSKRFL